jgi:hypothetical protein
MKKVPILIIIAILPCVLFAQDIRNSSWGDSISAVKLNEKVDFKDVSTDGITILYYDTEVGGLSVSIAFLFINDKLFKVRYLFDEEHADEDGYLTDYLSVKKLLDSKYGDSDTQQRWNNDLYKSDTQKYGFATSIGHVVFQDDHENEKTNIIHVLQGDNYKIKHVVDYLSKDYKYLIEDHKKNKTNKDF